MTRRVLLTGAAGRIGSFFHDAYTDAYDFSLTDIVEPAETKGAPFKQADLSDFDAVRPLCDGIDTVVHLGADPSMDAPWESLLPNNVVATYNVFESARQAGCRRVVYASSINAVLGYPRDQQVHTSQPVYPINLYGATKCWGEALARYYSAAHGLFLPMSAVWGCTGPKLGMDPLGSRVRRDYPDLGGQCQPDRGRGRGRSRREIW